MFYNLEYVKRISNKFIDSVNKKKQKNHNFFYGLSLSKLYDDKKSLFCIQTSVIIEEENDIAILKQSPDNLSNICPHKL